jgi:hypothetical protein
MAAMEGIARRTGQNPGMVLAVLTATVAQMLDLGTFVRMVTMHGSIAEANPIVAGLLNELGVPFVAVTKVAALSLVVAVIAFLVRGEGRPSHGRLAACILAVAIVAGIFGAWTNTAIILVTDV